MQQSDLDRWHMTRALELAALGHGGAEPNPLVGCVIVQGAEIIGEGYHRRFGGPHAEIEALSIAGSRARGATMYVTLEPCCHWGKTPPCSQAVIAAGIQRVVVAMIDPFPQVAGGGLHKLRAAGLNVETGVLGDEAQRLNAPYLKLLQTGRPWVIAKWAMTLDGKLATSTGSSQWISSAESRSIVHQLRGRVDAIVVGRGTVEADDPLLTARPAGARVATRVVLDHKLSIAADRQLLRTSADAPVLIAGGPGLPAEAVNRVTAAGCEVWQSTSDTAVEQVSQLLAELGRRQMTNVLVEGGAQVLGTLFDARLIDEVHVFIAPKIVGGCGAASPVGGIGIAQMVDALQLDNVQITTCGGDVYLSGRTIPRGPSSRPEQA